MQKLLKEGNVSERWTHYQVMQNTRSKIKARYQRAYVNIRLGYHHNLSRMARIKSFVKYEKMNKEKMADRIKPARLIQHRSYEYLYLLKAYAGPIDQRLKQSEIIINKAGQKLKEIFGNGKTIEEMAETIKIVASRHKNVVILCFDHSFWDGHFNRFLMKMGNLLYTTLNPHRLLRLLLKLQEKNRGKTQCGLIYEILYRVMSGEFITSGRNSWVNFLILSTIFPTASIIVNGDDSMVFITMEEFLNLDLEEILKSFSELGQETKLDKVAFSLADIEFCQSAPISFINGIKMVRKPERIFGRVQYTSHLLNDEKQKRYITGIGLCELASNKGIPVLQQFSLKLLELGEHKAPLALAREESNLVTLETAEILPITPEARTDFERAFGISVVHQLYLEEQFSANTDLEFINKYKNFPTLRESKY